MIPQNTLTPEPIVTDYLPPADEIYDPLRESHRGGLAISDGSHGRDTQTWVARYESGQIRIYAEGAVTPAFTVTVAGVQTVSLAFDNNMRPVVAYQTTGGSNLYYYSTVTESYQTITIADATSSRVCVDDIRDFYNTASDVIWAYVRGVNLCWRMQRDRYLTERVIGLAGGKTLVRIGQNEGRRLQFRLLLL